MKSKIIPVKIMKFINSFVLISMITLQMGLFQLNVGRTAFLNQPNLQRFWTLQYTYKILTWLLFYELHKNVIFFYLQSEDPEEDARLKQLQAAAAHWQQHQQHRVGFQYQGIMQKHTQLQQILQQYQQVIQQPPHIQASATIIGK